MLSRLKKSIDKLGTKRAIALQDLTTKTIKVSSTETIKKIYKNIFDILECLIIRKTSIFKFDA